MELSISVFDVSKARTLSFYFLIGTNDEFFRVQKGNYTIPNFFIVPLRSCDSTLRRFLSKILSSLLRHGSYPVQTTGKIKPFLI